jgi:hypothetical protein
MYTTRETGPRQAISNIEIDGTHATLTISAQELYAVLKCAGVLAEHERLHNTAARLRNDASVVRQLDRDDAIQSISITVN